MKSKLFMAAVALALPVAARAGDTGPELAFRTGFSFPFGHFTGAPPGSSPVAVSDLFHGFVPLGVEAGFRFTPDVYAGLVFQYAIGLWNGCPSNMSCSGHDVGLGFDVRYHPLPGRQVDPWFGIRGRLRMDQFCPIAARVLVRHGTERLRAPAPGCGGRPGGFAKPAGWFLSRVQARSIQEPGRRVRRTFHLHWDHEQGGARIPHPGVPVQLPPVARFSFIPGLRKVARRIHRSAAGATATDAISIQHVGRRALPPTASAGPHRTRAVLHLSRVLVRDLRLG